MLPIQISVRYWYSGERQLDTCTRYGWRHTLECARYARDRGADVRVAERWYKARFEPRLLDDIGGHP